MAKSLRSKWKRKMRAIKRERYGVKELNRLKNMLENSENKDAVMSELCTVLTKDSLSKLKNEIQQLEVKNEIQPEAEQKTSTLVDDTDNKQSPETGEMEVDVTQRKYHPKKLTDQYGNYPIWMSRRAIKKHKAKLGRKNPKKNKKKA